MTLLLCIFAFMAGVFLSEMRLAHRARKEQGERFDGFAKGICTACDGKLVRGPSGAWWHVDQACGFPHA